MDTTITADKKVDSLQTTLTIDSSSKKVDSMLGQASIGNRPPISPTNKVEKPLAAQPQGSQNTSGGSFGTFNTTVYSCGSPLSGSYYGSGYYTYPNYSLNFSSIPAGSTINISVSSYDVPNRFFIYDLNNNLITSSGWMGYANYSGPWGMSLNTLQNKILTFNKGNINDYVLKVETSTQSYSDGWEGSVSCIASTVTTNGNRLKFSAIELYEQYADNEANRSVLSNLATGSSTLTTLEESNNVNENLYPEFLKIFESRSYR
ncbi:MAG: hypothetical protein EWV82_18015 [Microcystis aeruginosa Ma_AC_P_19900807_S299]|nr:MAG: hypothetical protein EWV82_18015 [Microcystis aeruginosa Ma_AC_P_19900807_S299]